MVIANEIETTQLLNQVHVGHCLEVLKRIPSNSVHCCVTSPPYWGLRDYGLPPVYWPAVTYSPMPGLPEITIPEQEASLGLEPDLWAFVGHMVSVFREVHRVLRDDGTLWLNLGDTYITSPPGNNGKFNNLGDGAYKRRQVRQLGHGEDMQAIYQKPKDLKMKDLAGIPWRVAYALQADGWYLRSDVIWHKPNPMPESIQDRPTKAHEYVFLLSKSERYFYDGEAIREEFTGTERKTGQQVRGEEYKQAHGDVHRGLAKAQPNPAGRNRRTVWTVATKPYSAAHFATFPPKLIEPMILASTSDYGACEECGNPWVRVIEKVSKSLPVEERHGRTGHNGQPPQISGNYWTGPTTKATGEWQPTCSCNAPTAPAVVLDIFGGSGTTGKVALANRRNFILIDANPTYATELATERLNGTQIKMAS